MSFLCVLHNSNDHSIYPARSNAIYRPPRPPPAPVSRGEVMICSKVSLDK
jgi:hypothetical protein